MLAESEEEARLGAAAVEVAYAPLPAILSIEQAIAQQSFLTEPERLGRGDPAATLASCRQQLEGELVIGGQEHFYLETQAALAWVDESDGLFVQSSTQHPAETQEIVARVLGRPRNQVVVQCLRMGGAFGGKEVQANAWAAVAALGAVKLRRPVRVRLTRQQDMVMTGKRHPFLARFRVGFSGEGKLQVLLAQLYSDGGWSLDLSAPIMNRAMFHIDNCYRVPHLEVLGRVCRTNHVSHTAFRGFGGPQGMVVIEEILDRVARQLDLPPAPGARAQLLPAQRRDPLRPDRARRRAHHADLGAAEDQQPVRPALGRDPAQQRAAASRTSAGWPSPRSSSASRSPRRSSTRPARWC